LDLDLDPVSSYPTRAGVSPAQKNEEPRRSTEISGARVTVEEETSEGVISANNCISKCTKQLSNKHIRPNPRPTQFSYRVT
jgi:hypothetical protein